MEEKKVCNHCGNRDKEESSFAKELLNGYKKQCRNWFIAFLVVVNLWFATIVGFVHFLNQYTFESYSVEQSTIDGGNANYIGNDGDILNGIPKSNSPQND